VLVNNAGVGLSGALEDTSVEEAAWQMDINVFGVLRMTRAALPLMRSQGSGRVITISSLGGLTGMAYQPLYAASKHAVEGLISSLRLELADSPIDACTVAPATSRPASPHPASSPERPTPTSTPNGSPAPWPSTSATSTTRPTRAASGTS
jgi:short-subunit dehydrogenase